MRTERTPIMPIPTRTETTEHRDALRRLRRKLRSTSPTPSLLYQLMGFGHFVRMAMTRDGLLIGQPHRCVGFDAFIGSPTPGMRNQNARVWLELDAREQQLVLDHLAEQEITPESVGIIPEDDRRRSCPTSTNGTCAHNTRDGRHFRRSCHE